MEGFFDKCEHLLREGKNCSKQRLGYQVGTCELLSHRCWGVNWEESGLILCCSKLILPAACRRKRTRTWKISRMLNRSFDQGAKYNRSSSLADTFVCWYLETFLLSGNSWVCSTEFSSWWWTPSIPFVLYPSFSPEESGNGSTLSQLLGLSVAYIWLMGNLYFRWGVKQANIHIQSTQQYFSL